MSDTRIIAFDTSAAHCAAALRVGAETVEERLEHLSRGQAERLMPMLEEILAARGLCWRDLDAVAVGTGPGNFTGLRIAVSAARGLALSLGCPAVGVSLFEVMRDGLPKAGEELVSLEGPRGTAYVQRFCDGDPAGAPTQIDPDDIPSGLGPALRVTGYAAGRLARAPGAEARESALHDIAPRIARLAAARLADGAPIARPAPLYIRPADAAPPREASPLILP